MTSVRRRFEEKDREFYRVMNSVRGKNEVKGGGTKECVIGSRVTEIEVIDVDEK